MSNTGKEQDNQEKKPESNEFSSDYREVYQKPGEKKSNKSKFNSTINTTVNAVKSVTKKNMELISADTSSSEPESEMDDFLPKGEENEDDELLTKHSEPFTKIKVEDIAVVKHHGKRKYGLAVGSLVMVFALVGVCFLAVIIGQQVYKSVTDDSKLRAYDTFLSAIVMQDPEPFEASASANEEMVLKASVWRAVTVNSNEYTNYDDSGRTLVPLVDVVDACHELFGPDCELQPQSLKEETYFEYDSKDNEFHVSPYSSQSSFAPYTVSIRKTGADTVLKVGYVSAGDEWRSDSDSSNQATKPKPTKYMEYVIKLNAATKKEYVSAVRAVVEK